MLSLTKTKISRKKSKLPRRMSISDDDCSQLEKRYLKYRERMLKTQKKPGYSELSQEQKMNKIADPFFKRQLLGYLLIDRKINPKKLFQKLKKEKEGVAENFDVFCDAFWVIYNITKNNKRRGTKLCTGS